MVSYSVVIPCFNDADRLVRNAFLLSKFVKSRRDVEVVVVDDGSCDADREKLVSCCAAFHFRLVRYPLNRGKWCAVRTGVLSSACSHFVLCDSDLSVAPWHSIAAYERLGGSSVFMAGDRNRFESGIPLYRRFVGGVFSLLVRFVMGSSVFWYVKDTQCPCKVAPIHRGVFKGLEIDGFAGDVELIHAYDLFGFEIRRVDVLYVNDRRSKVRLRDVFLMARDVFRIRARGWL